MKKFTRILSMIVVLAICISCFAGCSLFDKSPKTAAELLTKSQEVMAEIGTNYNMKMTMGVNANLSMNGGEEGSISIKLPLKMNADMDMAGNYIHGKVNVDGTVDYSMSFGGEEMTESQEMKEKVEIYSVIEGNKAAAYTKTGNSSEWVVTEETAAQALTNMDANAMLNMNDIFATAEMVKNEESYTVTVKLADMMKSEAFKKVMSDAMNSADLGVNMNTDDLAAAFGDATMTYTFDSEYRLIKCATGDIRFDIMPLIEKALADNAKTDDSTEGVVGGDELSVIMQQIAGMQIDLVMSMSFEFSKFGEIKEDVVKVSDTIVKNAVSEPSNGEEGGDDETDDPGEPDDKGISTNWKDLDIMIDGVLYQFPYNYDELKDNGWTMDLAEYGYEDGYVLNKGDMTYATIELAHANYGKNWDSFTIWCGFANYNEKAIDITQGDLWAIELDITDGWEVMSKYPEVYISHGITWGATQDEIVAAFGEPSSTYESDEYNYIVLEYIFDYDIYMELTITEGFGLTCIDLSSYV